tara:strand:- start:512 stop:775 length:264 start_codon:yes stop_codon:yes gene_type:complete
MTTTTTINGNFTHWNFLAPGAPRYWGLWALDGASVDDIKAAAPDGSTGFAPTKEAHFCSVRGSAVVPVGTIVAPCEGPFGTTFQSAE